MKKIILVVALAIIFAGGFQTTSALASTDLNGWAWSSNIGWISFNASNSGSQGGNYRVSAVTTTQVPSVAALSGYAWSSNVGWIQFSSSATGCPASEASFDKPVAQNGTGADLPYGVTNICAPRVDISTGKVSGWARVLSIAADDSTSGWLHLSGTNHPTGLGGVTYNTSSGAFTGYAYEPSSVGWIDFAYTGLSPGVKICTTGTAGCPPVVVAPTCSIGTITISGNDVLIPIDLPTGSTYYSLNRDGVEVDRSRSDDVIVDSGLALVPGTYTYQIVKTSGKTPCGNPVVFTVTDTPPPSTDSGLKLLIGSQSSSFNTADFADTTDMSAAGKSYRVVKGAMFRLQWNISPSLTNAGYNSCSGSVLPSNGPSGNWGNMNSPQKYALLSTTNVSTGSYTFTLTCTGPGALPPKSSTVKLQVVSSSVEET